MNKILNRTYEIVFLRRTYDILSRMYERMFLGRTYKNKGVRDTKPCVLYCKIIFDFYFLEKNESID